MKLRQSISTIITGAAMGAADVVPGVSGGTILFIADRVLTLGREWLMRLLKEKVHEVHILLG